MENTKNVQTSVQELDLDIDSLFSGAPGADSIVTPSGSDAKPNIFSSAKTDLGFLDSDDATDDVVDDKDVSRETPKSTETKIDVDDLVDGLEDDADSKKSPGRPKTEKSGLVEFLRKRIESKEMFAFDDFDETKQDLGDYLGSLSEKDIDELWQANIDNMKQEVASKTPQEFFESLPDELQYAAKYVADGGEDLKGLFQALAQVEQIRELDADNESDQETIVRNYFQAKGESDDSIDEMIAEWKDLGNLGKKAQMYKPKLDQMQEKMVQAKLQEQEIRKQQLQEAAEAYMQNVFEALRPAELNGLKLDKKTQAQLYSGLTQTQYPSISGRPTNLLGHLLEKYQYVEPNYSLIAEALWLLSNPDEYRSTLMKQGKNAAVEQTVRTLKTEQSRKTASTYQEEEERPRKIARPQNIFKR